MFAIVRHRTQGNTLGNRHFLPGMTGMSPGNHHCAGSIRGVRIKEDFCAMWLTIGYIPRVLLSLPDRSSFLSLHPEGDKRGKHTNRHTFVDLKTRRGSHPRVSPFLSLTGMQRAPRCEREMLHGRT